VAKKSNKSEFLTISGLFVILTVDLLASTSYQFIFVPKFTQEMCTADIRYSWSKKKVAISIRREL